MAKVEKMDYGEYQKIQGEKFVQWLKSAPTKWFFLVFFLAILGSMFLGLMNHYFVARDVDDWAYRAQIASNIQDMKADMGKAKAGLEKWKATQGNAFLIFKRPEADMDLVMQSVNTIITRATQLEGLAMNSTEYQVGIDDLRGTIRELWIPAGTYWQRHQGLAWFLATIILWILDAGLLGWSIFRQIKRKD